MRKVFTYLFSLVLFLACAMNSEIAPGNMSESVLGFVQRNIKKDRQELFQDMKQLTKEGLIHFELYDETGLLVATLKEPNDFNTSLEKSFGNSKMTIKSISQIEVKIPSNLVIAF